MEEGEGEGEEGSLKSIPQQHLPSALASTSASALSTRGSISICDSNSSDDGLVAGDDVAEIDESADIPLGGSALGGYGPSSAAAALAAASLAAASAPPPPYGSRPPEVYFKDISLIDRFISVVHINVAGFHLYVLNTHPEKVRADWGAFLTFVHNEARRFGGCCCC